MNNKLKSIIINETATIKEAMSKLQKSSKKILQKKITTRIYSNRNDKKRKK